MNVVYVTGNEYKASLFNHMLGREVEHMQIDVEEIQSLDIRAVVQHKARAAYEKAKRPVIVEDTFLRFTALGGLPGPFIKWFLDELKPEGLCRLLNGKNRTATAGAAIAYYDGTILEIFEKELFGSVAEKPRGDTGFGWNPIFIPDGSALTLGEMADEEFEKWYKKVKPFDKLAEFLDTIANK